VFKDTASFLGLKVPHRSSRSDSRGTIAIWLGGRGKRAIVTSLGTRFPCFHIAFCGCVVSFGCFEYSSVEEIEDMGYIPTFN